MVIGNGLMAKTFSNYRDDNTIIIFASGVSNSTTHDSSEFIREFNLVKETVNNNNKKFVYFSTCSIDDASVNQNPYVEHKLQIEDFIIHNCEDYLIFRVSNVVGPFGNKNTIMNYLFEAVKNRKKIDVWSKAERNLIDRVDLQWIVSEILNKNESCKIINIATRESVLVVDILKLIENHLGIKGTVNMLEKGNKINIDISYVNDYIKEIESKKNKGLSYIIYLLTKYY